MKAIEVFGKGIFASSLLIAAIPLGVILVTSATVEEAITDEAGDDILDGYRQVLEDKINKMFNS